MQIFLSQDGTQLMEDIERKDLDDVTVDAVPVQELGAQRGMRNVSKRFAAASRSPATVEQSRIN